MKKNLLYRKTILKNTYIFSKNLDIVMDYDEYKKVIINDEESDYKYIELIKLVYLYQFVILENKDTDVRYMLVNLEESLLKQEIRIDFNVNECLDEIIEKTIKDVSIKIENQIKRYTFMYILINYIVYLKYEKMYRLSYRFMKKLYEVSCVKELYPDLIILLNEEIKRGYYPDVKFYEELKELTKEEIISEFIKNKGMINEKYKITELYLYGSFVKGNFRIDSDIDVAVVFQSNMSYKEKEEKSMALKEYIKETFKRYGDVMEYNTSILKDEKREKIY